MVATQSQERECIVPQPIPLFLAAMLFMPVAAAGQGAATPARQERAVFPATDECRVEPRTTAELVALTGTPIPVGEMEQQEPFAERMAAMVAEFDAPRAEPVDAQTVSGVEATIRELYACVNARDGLAALALVSDEALARISPSDLLLIDGLFPQDPPPLPADETVGYEVAGAIGLLPDGSLAAPIQTILPSPDANNPFGTLSFVWFLRPVGDRFLVDGVLVADPGRTITIYVASP